MTTRLSQHQYSLRVFSRNYEIAAHHVLLGLIASAILLRVASSLFQGNTVDILPGVYDQISYNSLAQRLLNGHGFTFAENHWPITRPGEPTAHWSFLYTFYLAGIYALFGPHPLVARILQAVLVGALQTYLTYRITEKTFTKGIALIAAGITAFYIYFIYYSGSLMTEPFYITAILSSLYAAMGLAESNSRERDVKLGVVLGIALSVTVLLRQVFLLFLPFLLAWIWISRIRRRHRLPIISIVLSLGIVLLSILPFSLYNQSRFGRFVLLNTNSGYAFFWGNHPIYGTNFIPILPKEMGTYQDLIPDEVRHLDEAALDQELLKRGIQFVVDDPGRYLLLSLSRIPAYFMFWPSAESSLISNISRVASFGIVFPFMLYGLFLTVRDSLRKKETSVLKALSSPEGLLIIFVLIYTLIHLLTWALIRYRLPVDAVLIPFAALAVSNIFHKVTTGKTLAS
jgi:4-amino-4-deoxy-L-arabinose transferase-like glycosyltransferase